MTSDWIRVSRCCRCGSSAWRAAERARSSWRRNRMMACSSTMGGCPLTVIIGPLDLASAAMLCSWVGGCGRAIPGNWTARERPALAGWLAAHPASRSGVDVGERRRNRAGLARNGERDVREGDGPDKDLGLLRARALEGEVFNRDRIRADGEGASSCPRLECHLAGGRRCGLFQPPGLAA